MKAAAAFPAIALTPEGFSVLGTSVSWLEVIEIEAYKLDLITTDEIRVAFTLESGPVVEVSEEQPGFPEFAAALVEHFPTAEGWQSKVIPNAFKSNRSVLYRRI